MSQIVAVSMEQICAEAVKAARDVLTSHGIERPSVVVNFAWAEPDPYSGSRQTFAIGTAVPRAHRLMMADSLRQSAEEAAA